MKKVSIIMLTIAALLLTLVTASATTTILYNGVTASGVVNVSVHPDVIAPPISIRYDGESGNMYRVTLIKVTVGQMSPACEFSGEINSDPFVLNNESVLNQLGICSIQANDAGTTHTLTACVGSNCSTSNAVATVELYPVCNAECQRNRAIGSGGPSSKGGPIEPIPEISTIGMFSLGVLGLLIVVRNRNKN